MSLWIGRKERGDYELGTEKEFWHREHGFDDCWLMPLVESEISLSRPLKKGECVKIKGKIRIELE